MLKAAFNMLIALHSKPATLKRLGAVDMFTPIKITPSNYFRFLRGPEYTSISGTEVIIPVSSMLGQFAQRLSFSTLPTAGTFKIKYGAEETSELEYNSTEVQIQTALRLLTGLSNVEVSGNFISGFFITFVGFSAAPAVPCSTLPPV